MEAEKIFYPQYVALAAEMAPQHAEDIYSAFAQDGHTFESQFSHVCDPHPAHVGSFLPKRPRTNAEMAVALVPWAVNLKAVERLEDLAEEDAYPEPKFEEAEAYLDSLRGSDHDESEFSQIAEKLIRNFGLSTENAYAAVMASVYWEASFEYFAGEGDFSIENARKNLREKLVENTKAVRSKQKQRYQEKYDQLLASHRDVEWTKEDEAFNTRFSLVPTPQYTSDPPSTDSEPAHLPRGIKQFAQIKPDLSKIALVKGLLGEQSYITVFGPPNSAKTFFALWLSYCIATGNHFFGRKVSKGGVLYVFTEAGFSGEKRVKALLSRYGNEAAPLFISTDSINLVDSTSVSKLVQAVRKLSEICGGVKLVVIDTLANSISGYDENSAEDMGKLNESVGRIQNEAEVAVLLVHHTGKNVERGLRGSNALEGRLDTSIEITLDPKSGVRSAQPRKQRDFDNKEAFHFKLEDVFLGKDSDGDDVKSAVVAEVTSNPTANLPKLRPNSAVARALTVLKDLTKPSSAADHFESPQGVDESDWRKAFTERHYPNAKRTTSTDAFFRASKFLKDGGYVIILESGKVAAHAWS